LTPELLRRLAERCRELQKKAIDPEVTEQLAIWAVEFEVYAANARGIAPTQGPEHSDPLRDRP
jgi:hypothetical protein